jgi:hydroxyacylglutathione hydrolase
MLRVSYVRAFDDNYIWLIHTESGRHVAIVDPGDAEPVQEAIDAQALEPVAILITHHHGDHTGGIRELTRQYDVPVYGPVRERIPGITHPLQEGDQVHLDRLPADFRVMDVAGHTRGHIAYYGHGLLFCGDTLFTGGCGRLFEGTPAQMYNSLTKIAALPEDTRVYCAHEYTLDNLRFAKVVEPENEALHARIAQAIETRKNFLPTVPSTLALEKATNPFLRCDRSNVIQAAERFSGKPLQSGSETFAVVRYWKDTLD